MKISVIIPAHNGGESIGCCLDALQKTHYDNWECIVVDDCSTDNTVALTKSFGFPTVVRSVYRLGPAEARNLGAQVARGDVLLFLDADVLVQSGTIGHVAAIFQSESGLAACFGAYDDQPTATNFLTQFRTLQQVYVHQHSAIESSTFRTKCGAIRRSIFLSLGGFHASSSMRPGIEDIELGYRLHRHGYAVRSERLLQVKHMKHWELRSMVTSDIWDRAIPWTQLIVRNRFVPNDLNLQTSQRLSTAVSFVALIACLFTAVSLWSWLLVGLAIFQLLWLNRYFYQFLGQKRGFLFLIRAIPMHWLYFFYTGIAFLIGLFTFKSVKFAQLLQSVHNKPFYSSTIHPFDTR